MVYEHGNENMDGKSSGRGEARKAMFGRFAPEPDRSRNLKMGTQSRQLPRSAPLNLRFNNQQPTYSEHACSRCE